MFCWIWCQISTRRSRSSLARCSNMSASRSGSQSRGQLREMKPTEEHSSHNTSLSGSGSPNWRQVTTLYWPMATWTMWSSWSSSSWVTLK